LFQRTYESGTAQIGSSLAKRGMRTRGRSESVLNWHSRCFLFETMGIGKSLRSEFLSQGHPYSCVISMRLLRIYFQGRTYYEGYGLILRRMSKLVCLQPIGGQHVHAKSFEAALSQQLRKLRSLAVQIALSFAPRYIKGRTPDTF